MSTLMVGMIVLAGQEVIIPLPKVKKKKKKTELKIEVISFQLTCRLIL